VRHSKISHPMTDTGHLRCFVRIIFDVLSARRSLPQVLPDAVGKEASFANLLDHLVGGGEQLIGNSETERFGCLQIYH
jgi:hypothetical protein